MSVPEGPRLEVGPALGMEGWAREGGWIVRLSEAVALNNDGSHFETEGIGPGGGSVPAPLHRHEVEMDVYRTVLDLEYQVAGGMAWRIKLPWEVRDRQASVGLVDPATPEEQESMQRNLDLHHPDATLSGVRDLELTGARAWRGALAREDRLEFAAGFTLPIGETESNPYAVDADGDPIAHEHVQFGSGTVDPLLQLTWGRLIGEDWSGSAYAAARIPLYENRHDYRAPRELTLSGGVGRALGAGWHLRGTLTGVYSSQAEWSGVPDVNTGWVAGYAGLGAEWHGARFAGSLLVQMPFAQNTLGEGDETFDLGPVISLALGGAF